MNTKLNQILAEISAGELLDKITILEIKKEKIKDNQKLKDIDKELLSLTKTSDEKIPDKKKINDLIIDLKQINLKLWDIEENKRLAEKNQKFDEKFIKLSRDVYKTNDARAKIKLKINEILEKTERALVRIESQLDFSDEEGVVEVEAKEVLQHSEETRDCLRLLIKEYKPFEKDALKKNIVLLGKPNVGKSSLFNLLVGEKAAIVSSAAGTTRDVVRKRVVMSGFDVEVQDTAGLRKTTNDNIEKEGMLLALAAAKGADLVLHVVDNAAEAEAMKEKPGTIIVFNKYDLHQKPFSGEALCVSAKTGLGLDVLVEKIKATSLSSATGRLVSERVYKKLVLAEEILSASLGKEDFFEVAAQNLREVLVALQEIYGVFDNEKILDQIFKNFCIGK